MADIDEYKLTEDERNQIMYEYFETMWETSKDKKDKDFFKQFLYDDEYKLTEDERNQIMYEYFETMWETSKDKKETVFIRR